MTQRLTITNYCNSDKVTKPFKVTINDQTHIMEYVRSVEDCHTTYHVIECILQCCTYPVRIWIPDLATDGIIPQAD